MILLILQQTTQLKLNTMKQKKILKDKYKVCNSIEDLNETDQAMFKLAFEKMNEAYAPYSNFHVGAALLLDDGNIIGGSNQENASYGLSMCAERVALFNAGANYPDKKVKKIVVVTKNYDNAVENRPENDIILAPCGACRQVILEYETRYQNDIEIMLIDSKGKVISFESVKNLLPFAFSGYFLK
ncbi:MAG: cytidine deaminase [Saprospiraceae bacterium]